MKLIQERQQIMIFCIASLLAVSFLMLRFFPLRKRIASVERDKAVQKAIIAKSQAQSQRLPQLEEQLTELAKSVEKYGANIPSHKGFGEFLQQMTETMNKHNLTNQLIQPRKQIESDNLNCIPVKIQCVGRLNQIFEFFKSLEVFERLIRIERVNLSNDKDFDGQLKMETEAFIYYKPDTKQGQQERLVG